MDIEELKMILETIQSMGGDAKQFGIWWLLCSTLPALVGNGLLFIFGCLVVSGIVRTIRMLVSSFAVSNRMARMMGFNFTAPWSVSEERQVFNRLEELPKAATDTTNP